MYGSQMSGDGASVPWKQAIALLSDFNSQAEKQMPFEALPKSQNVIVLGIGLSRSHTQTTLLGLRISVYCRIK